MYGQFIFMDNIRLEHLRAELLKIIQFFHQLNYQLFLQRLFLWEMFQWLFNHLPAQAKH